MSEVLRITEIETIWGIGASKLKVLPNMFATINRWLD